MNQHLAASGGEAIPGPPIPSTATDDTVTEDMDHETEETTSEPSQSQPLSYTQVSDPNEELSPSSASRDLFDTSPQSRKRAPLVTGEIGQFQTKAITCFLEYCYP